MTWEKFWSIIDRVRAQADMQDEASVKQFLYTELIKLPQDELLGFDCVFQQIRCLCTTACNLQNNVNQFFLRVVKFNSVNCQKNQHNVGADALVAIHEWVIAD